ncbi:hypothetical protein [Nocardia flavorosea]|uniref:hypothetical protein n=1 Tax=Nocardia flavorosea TaxID=53429 RepID=UPI0035307C3B
MNTQTLRYYEHRGRRAEPDRPLAGTAGTRRRGVVVIEATQLLGFTLDEVAGLLAAPQFRGLCPAAGLRAHATAKTGRARRGLAEPTAARTTLRAPLADGGNDLPTGTPPGGVRPRPHRPGSRLRRLKVHHFLNTEIDVPFASWRPLYTPTPWPGSGMHCPIRPAPESC